MNPSADDIRTEYDLLLMRLTNAFAMLPEAVRSYGGWPLWFKAMQGWITTMAALHLALGPAQREDIEGVASVMREHLSAIEAEIARMSQSDESDGV